MSFNTGKGIQSLESHLGELNAAVGFCTDLWNGG